MKEVNTHPDRIKYPLMRVGNRGEGKWRKVTWDEMLDQIAGKINEHKNNHGPESVAICIGEPKGMENERRVSI